jgi:hypothetical protein
MGLVICRKHVAWNPGLQAASSWNGRLIGRLLSSKVTSVFGMQCMWLQMQGKVGGLLSRFWHAVHVTAVFVITSSYA